MKKNNKLTFKRASNQVDYFGTTAYLLSEKSQEFSWDVKITFDFDILNSEDDIIKGINRFKEIKPHKEFRCLKKGQFSN
jgi:hypothetical protein